ncbi:FecR family protein [Chitinophaga niastensis]|uniref:FecR family protein n=1 Tax=Chitinophaga niastensis TaxID=536980 RepID=A0A2P8HDS4_CHINA|nr:FecR domain-containing protein [Chitinophaga niastensis]PSL44281.1 FecR family protein [Chitinophaga niastensis]
MEPDIHIANIIGKHLNHEASAEENACLQEWLMADPVNQEEYAAYQSIWQNSDMLLTNKMFDIQQAWTKINTRIHTSGRIFNMHTWKKLGAAAAVITIIAMVAWGFQRMYGPAAIQHLSARYDNQQVVLPDGTLVHLRKGTMLSYPRSFDTKERLISLEGEGFFEVAARAAAPFRISTPLAMVEVLGTSFFVNTAASTDKITVSSGKVMFAEKNNRQHHIILSAGQTATLSGKQFTEGNVTDANDQSWQTGILEFRNTLLQEVVNKLSDYYHVNIVLSDEVKDVQSQLRINVRFVHQPLEEALEEIKLTTGLGIKKEHQRIILYRP